MCQFWDDESARAEIGSVGNQFTEPRVRRVLCFADAARSFLAGLRAAGFFAGSVDTEIRAALDPFGKRRVGAVAPFRSTTKPDGRRPPPISIGCTCGSANVR